MSSRSYTFIRLFGITTSPSLTWETEAIERALDELRARKESLAEDDYLAQLEELLVRIAETDAAIRARGERS
jgi:hypothetical protein